MKYATYEDYKNSASDWLGSVPSHWHVNRLKWSTTGCYNGVWGDEPNDLDDLICVRVADFDRDRFVVVSNPPTIRAIEAGQRRNRILQKNDLLIEKSGGGEKQLVGCVVQLTEDFPAVCSNFVARLPVARGCDPRYLTYLHSAIYTARLNYPAIKQTTGIQNLDSGEYLNILAAYPPLDEQQTIARFLDAKTAQIDALVAQKRQLIDKLKEKRQALIARTVTRGLPPEAAKAAGLDPNPEMKDSGVEWLGKIPCNWHVKRLRYLGNAIIGLTYDPSDVSDQDDGTLVLRSSNVQGARISFDDNVFVRGTIPSKLRTRLGDILICSRNGSRALIGKNARIDERSVGITFGAFMTIFRSQFSEFLYWVFNSEMFTFQSGAFLTSTINQLTVNSLNSFSVALPPKEEQQHIALYLNRETAQLDNLISSVESAITRLTEYRQALITSAVTGKIDVRDFRHARAGGHPEGGDERA